MRNTVNQTLPLPRQNNPKRKSQSHVNKVLQTFPVFWFLYLLVENNYSELKFEYEMCLSSVEITPPYCVMSHVITSHSSLRFNIKEDNYSSILQPLRWVSTNKYKTHNKRWTSEDIGSHETEIWFRISLLRSRKYLIKWTARLLDSSKLWRGRNLQKRWTTWDKNCDNLSLPT